MAARKVIMQLDEDLVRRVRQNAIGAIGMSDAEVIEDALAAYLSDRALNTQREANLEPAGSDDLRP
jgi:hypothetical protein